MKTRNPTPDEIAKLVAFLPKLEEEGFSPITRWEGGPGNHDGATAFPWPVYAPLVHEFIDVASNECWIDFDYLPIEARRMLEDQQAVETADLGQIKTMITYCVRGERFCDGHWGAMIELGHISRLLQRLSQLYFK